MVLAYNNAPKDEGMANSVDLDQTAPTESSGQTASIESSGQTAPIKSSGQTAPIGVKVCTVCLCLSVPTLKIF